MHRNSSLIFDQRCLQYFRDGDSILEVGPGGYPSYYLCAITQRFKRIEYACCDRNNTRIEHRVKRSQGRGVFGGEVKTTVYKMNCESIIAEDGTFDVVFSGQVLGFAQRPWILVTEMARVIRPGGLLIAITPVSWKYAPCPFDGWRILASGLRSLYEDSRVDVIECGNLSLDKTGVDIPNQIGGGEVVDSYCIGRKPA